ncbi:MAG: branched-chain amino acid ABC transporter permease [Methylocystaceae bacterium]
MKPITKFLLNLLLLITVGIVLYWSNNNLDPFQLTILTLCGINVVLVLSMNLINGFTGQFALGHAGFMAIGAYVMAILTMTPAAKEMNWFAVPIWAPLHNLQVPFLVALILAGLVAALFGYLVGLPVLRLRGDYLAIATLGFAEVIRIVIINLKPLTNGALGLKSIPTVNHVYFWVWGAAIVTIYFMMRLINSSYGLALKSITEDEIAAQAMGVNLYYHKQLSFTLSAFFAGVGGALLGNFLGTVDPSMFTFMVTFNILLIVVLGGLGSITGSVVGAIVITIFMEWLRIVEYPMNFGLLQLPGIPGMRMVIFSFLLVLVIIFWQQGLLGKRELSWETLTNRFGRGRKSDHQPEAVKEVE